MKKYLTLITVALALTILASPTAALEKGFARDEVLVSLDSQGNVICTDIDGLWDVQIGYGDPDDGITGNRGDSAGTGSGCYSIPDVPETDLLDLLYAWMQQWRIQAR